MGARSRWARLSGKILTSRNGTAEPLYGIAATTPSTITTPGKAISAVINVSGALSKAVDLEPFTVGGNDTIYGGLGNDSLHGGAGVDGISGAEAQSGFYASPGTTPKIVYDVTSGKFTAFVDGPAAVDSLKKLPGHPLNFDAFSNPANPAGSRIDDGADNLFGDDDADWLVGGTNSDHLYGGKGNDVLNADDNLETAGGLNNVADAAPFGEADTAYGGGGRDTLTANSGSDRLIDWIGEFNTYVVPFSPFGLATVLRDIRPQVPEFLYSLSASDGVDRTRGGDVTRNGEPDGELGLFLPKDNGFKDQIGGPSDPQAGNNPGVAKY